MAMVQPRSARYRLWATHAALLAFVAVTLGVLRSALRRCAPRLPA